MTSDRHRALALAGPSGGSGGLGPLLLASVILIPIAMLGPNTLLALLAWATLLLGLRLLWRPGEPPILLLIFAYQWLQASIGLFYGNLLGFPVDHWTEHGGQHERAILLTLLSLAVLAISIRVVIGPQAPGLSQRIRAYILAYPLTSWFAVYAGAWLFSQLCLFVAPMSQGLYQPLLFLSQFRWAAFFLLTVATFSQPRQRKIFWITAFAFEFLQSVGGYFSSFSDVFLYTIVGLAASNVKLSVKSLIPLALAGVALVFTGIVWSGIKADYRSYASKGARDQTVRIGTVEKFTEIQRLIGEMDSERFGESTNIMVTRLMYFEFFGVILDRVPAAQPFSDGEIWGAATLSPFTPRLLFPNKPAVDDTKLTEKYTGIHVAAWGFGVSISMGYIAEAYIDFGPVLMFAAIAALGLYMGGLYRWLLGQKGPKLALGAALAPMALMPAHLLESSSLKVIPPLVLSLVGCWFILSVLSKQLARRQDRRGGPTPSRRKRIAAFS
jgi:hypothetical protein